MIKTQQVIDWSDEINFVQSKEKDLVLAILGKYFDVEQVPISGKVKHYPIETALVLTEDEEENAALCEQSLERLSRILWNQVLGVIGSLDLTKDEKLGKLIYCPSNRFQYCDKEKEPFKLYCFEHDAGIKAEINFTIEFY